MDYSIVLPTTDIIDLFDNVRRIISSKRKIAGLVFFPVREVLDRNYPCVGIRICVAYWIPNRPDTLEFAELNQNSLFIYNPSGPFPLGRPNERTLNNLSHNMWETLDPIVESVHEFDLVFLDYFQ